MLLPRNRDWEAHGKHASGGVAQSDPSPAAASQGASRWPGSARRRSAEGSEMRPKMDWWHSASERPRPQRRDSSSSDCEHPRLPRSYLASSGAPRLRIRNRLHHRRRRRHRLRSSAGRDSVFDLVEGGPFQHSLRDAETVLRQLPSWVAHYSQVHPHRAVGHRSPREFIGSIHLGCFGWR